MNALLLATLCALAALGIAHADAAQPRSVDGSPKSAAFVSKREGAEMVKRQKRNLNSGYGAAGAAPQVAVNPLEAQREVCELSPACDELADHIGFQEAYRQFYGPV
ncbi:osteocalcin [Thamnophis elegans]|uniref:osteocalcin n=1 Tax=Thamnophis elegans TaxID=35005 RepID=UPI001378DE66|nr:osteocalcin [Thamnophis elegans]